MAWYNEDGQSRSYVLSTRVRFARNLVDYPFSERMNREIALEILGKIEAALPELQRINFEDLPDPVSLSYAEKRLVSRDFLSQRLPHLLFLGEGEKLAVMAMEEDHLLHSGDPAGACRKGSLCAGEEDRSAARLVPYLRL